jgi:SAM-dependent methyltransferase
MAVARKVIRRVRRYWPADYWEGRARQLITAYDSPETWGEKGWLRANAEDRTVPKLLRDHSCESVLVLGAGAGRQYAYLTGFDIFGFDISPTLVAECLDRFPGVPTVEGQVVGCERIFGVKDAVLSSAVLAHIPPRYISKAIRSVKASARRLVVIREYSALGATYQYQFSHDYEALFQPWPIVYREVTDDRDGHVAELIAFAAHP